jgi:Na+/H+ antiporter NhaD/arsenite permease-like protein
MVMTPIAIAICARYRLPSTWLLCGMRVASNLGGFSTRWGDTPNLIEAGVWGLSDGDFLREILPLNLVILAGLTAVVSGLTITKGMDRSLSAAHVAYASQTFGEYARDTRLDWRLLTVGCAGLASFIVIQFLWRDLEIIAAAAVILMTVALDRNEDRLSSLQALGLDTYMTLLSVFMIAHGLSQSLLGGQLQGLIAATHGAPWAVAISSYLGTGLTEAASWAAAAAPAVYRVNPSHTAAWALGGGICAGSGSLLTAASAGIILWTESRRFPGHQVTFKTYLPFGIGFSLLMLVVYIAVLTALNAAGVVA